MTTPTRIAPLRTRLWPRLLAASALLIALNDVALAQLTEAESTATWVLNIFSPTLLLTLLTLLLIGCGLAVYLGRLSAGLFLKILLGSILVFGARSIAAKIIALFGG